MVAVFATLCSAVVLSAPPGGSGVKWIVPGTDPNDNVTAVRVSGTPHQMGWWYGNLLATEIRDNLDKGLQWASDNAQNDLGMPAWQLYYLIDQQIWPGMVPYIPAAFLEELQGVVDGAAEADPAVVPVITLNELRRFIVIVELAEFNCTSIGAIGPATHDGRLIQIRVLDFAMETGCQDNPVITVYQPDEGPGYCNVGFAGLIGSVAGMNAEGVAVCEVGLGTPQVDAEDPNSFAYLRGIPMTLLMKKIIAQSAPEGGSSALDKATQIIQDGPRTSNYGYGVGDGTIRDTKSFVTSREVCHVWGVNEAVTFHDPGNPASKWLWDPNDYPGAGDFGGTLPAIAGVTYLPHDADLTVSLLDPTSPDYVGLLEPNNAIEVARQVAMNSNLLDVVFDGEDLKLWAAFANGASTAQRAAVRGFVEFDFGGLMPNPMAFAVAPQAVSTTSVTMSAVQVTSLRSDPNHVQYAFSPAAGSQALGNESGWQSSATYVDTGLSANTRYAYSVRARDASSPSTVTAASEVMEVCTLANRPLAPTVTHGGGTTVDVTISPDDGNPDATECAIYDATRKGWIGAGGALQASKQWQARTAWGTVTVTGIDPARIPSIQVMARNQSGVETALGPPQGTGEHWSIGTRPDDVTVVRLTGPSGHAIGWHYGYQIAEQIRENLDSGNAWGVQLMMDRTGWSEHDVNVLLDTAWTKMKPYIPQLFLDELRGAAEGAAAAGQTVTTSEMQRAIVIAEMSEFNCSAIGASGPASYQGKTLQTRNLDFDMHTGMQNHPVIAVYMPDDAPAYCNVGFAGLIGVLAGMSAEQIAVSEAGLSTPQANPTDLELLKGLPMTLLLKKVLIEGVADGSTSALDQAVQTIEQGPRTTNYAYLIADALTGDSRMLATTKGTCEVFAPGEPIQSDDPNLGDLDGVGMPGLDNVTYIPPGGDYGKVLDLLDPGEPNYVGLVDLDKAVQINRALAMGSSCLMSVAYDLNALKLRVAYAEGPNSPASARTYVEFDFGQLVLNLRPDPMTFQQVPTALSTTGITMQATTASALQSPPVEYLFEETSGQPGGAGTDWQTSTTHTNAGLSANVQYSYRVKARDSGAPPRETNWSAVMTVCTLAEVPPAPTVGDATSDSLTVDPSAGVNPPATELAVYDATRETYIGANGSPSATPVWRTDQAWGQITVTGLDPETDYEFACKARNADGVETALSGTGGEATQPGEPANGDDDDDDNGDDDDDGQGLGSIAFQMLPTALGSTSVTMTAGPTTYAPDVPPLQYYFRETTGNAGGSSSGWQTLSSYVDVSLLPNTKYGYQVRARDSDSPPDVTGYSATAEVITPAAVPPAPTLSSPTQTSVRVNVSSGDNPPSTLLALGMYDRTQQSWVYLKGDGTVSPTPVWQTQLSWGMVEVTGLSAGQQCDFVCWAQHAADGTSTDPSDVGTGYTLAEDASPPRLSRVAVLGSTEVNEQASATYTVLCEYSDGSVVARTSGVAWRLSDTQWGVITAGGTFTAHHVLSDQQIWIYADVVDGSRTVTGQQSVTIKDLDGPAKPPTTPTNPTPSAPDGACPTAALAIFLSLVGGILVLRRRSV